MKYLSIEESSDIYDTRPDDYSKDKYRMLININEKWLKKTLKKINKLEKLKIFNLFSV